MSKIKLAGAQWSWVGASFSESALIYQALGVHAMDLIAAPGLALDIAQIENNPDAVANQIKADLADVSVELVNLMTLIGTDFHNRAINSPDKAVRDRNQITIRSLCLFAASSGLQSITLVPGVTHDGMSREDAQKIAADELRAATKIGKEIGIRVVFEPHRESVLESPEETVQFMQENDDLRICVDYSHCVSIGYKQTELHPLLPFAGHVHLRQGANTKIQARWDDGEIDFPALMQQLIDQGYEGYATLEYEHEDVWDMDKTDTMKETIAMRDAVRPYVEIKERHA